MNAPQPEPAFPSLIATWADAEKVAELERSTKVGQVGQPHEAAPSYVFLAGPDSLYMKSQVLHPNGSEIVA